MNPAFSILVAVALFALALCGCGKSVAPNSPANSAISATPSDVPLVGDWNGDGKAKPGVFRRGLWILDYNGDGVINSSDKTFQYTATPGDIPVIGDWNGDGKTKTGIFRNGQWILDYNGDGKIDYQNLGPDKVFQYTASHGDVPVVGDWNGDHRTKTGVFRSGQWILDYDGNGVLIYSNPGPDRVFQLISPR